MPTGAETLKEYIRTLSPERLRLFKSQLRRNLNTLPTQDRNRLYVSMSGIQELSDITGTAPRMPVPTPPVAPQPSAPGNAAD